MSNNYVISDTHFGHKNIVKFIHADGNPLRPWDTVEEHDKALISNWNEVVNDKDKVFVLGDVSLSSDGHHILSQLKGRKILIRGNHDDRLNAKDYLQYFEEIHGIYVGSILKRPFCMTHVPIHPQCVDRWGINIHGHLHAFNIENDERYVNVSCEQINYTPVRLDDIIKERYKLK